MRTAEGYVLFTLGHTQFNSSTNKLSVLLTCPAVGTESARVDLPRFLGRMFGSVRQNVRQSLNRPRSIVWSVLRARERARHNALEAERAQDLRVQPAQRAFQVAEHGPPRAVVEAA